VIPLTIIGGYLGAGKSTLLQRLVREPGDRILGLLINDFGSINIDAELIASADHNKVELTNGCICCSLADGFHEALETLLLRDPTPDHILVEASGVADVHSLAQYGHHPELSLSGVLVVVDSETVRDKSKDPYVGRTITRHIEAADLIIANKQDLASDTEREHLKAWLASVNPAAPVLPTTNANVPIDIALDHRVTDPTPSILNDPNPASPEANHLISANPTSSHATFERWMWQDDSPCLPDDVEPFLKAIPSTIWRLKGWLETDDGVLEIQKVGARHSIRPRSDMDKMGQSLIAIGLADTFESKRLDQLAAQHLAKAVKGTPV
jgi:G3E family GTPase